MPLTSLRQQARPRRGLNLQVILLQLILFTLRSLYFFSITVPHTCITILITPFNLMYTPVTLRFAHHSLKNTLHRYSTVLCLVLPSQGHTYAAVTGNPPPPPWSPNLGVAPRGGHTTGSSASALIVRSPPTTHDHITSLHTTPQPQLQP